MNCLKIHHLPQLPISSPHPPRHRPELHSDFFSSPPRKLSHDAAPLLAIPCSTSSSPQFARVPSEKQAAVVQPQGPGLAAHRLSGGKSRGDAFLEKSLLKNSLKLKRRNQGDEASEKMASSRKTKDKAPMQITGPCCYGCGAPLQTADAEAPGYVPLDIFQVKKKHHQLKTVLCGRCHLLAQGHLIPAVGGHGGYGGGKRFVSAEQLREQLSHLRNEKALIVKLVDIADFSGSFITRVRELVGANPIILVATKVDLLPKGTDLQAVGDWLVEYILRKKLNVLSVHMTSSKSLMGISGVISDIQQQRQGRDVYILGSANVGKSAFVSALLQVMAQRDPVAAAAQRHRPIQSAMPGTTLGPIQIDAFSGGGSLIDTPGIHLHHRMAAVVAPEDLTLLAPRRRLQGYLVSPWNPQGKLRLETASEAETRQSNLFQEKIENSMDEDNCSHLETTKKGSKELQLGGVHGQCLAGFSVFWGGMARLDIVKAPSNANFRLYGPSAVPICTVPSIEADLFYKEELGRALLPPTGKERADNWPGLLSQHTIRLGLQHVNRPVADIAISGLGWVTVEVGEYRTRTDTEESKMFEATDNEVLVVVYVPRGVEVFRRSPIPVGIHGPNWYEYSELTDEGLEQRPKIFCS